MFEYLKLQLSTQNSTRISLSRNLIRVTRAREIARAWAWHGMSQCSATTGPQPVGDIVSSLLSRRYVDRATDYWVDVASRSCYAGPQIHAWVNDNVQTVARTSPPPFKKYLVPQNISTRSAPAPQHSGHQSRHGSVGSRAGYWRPSDNTRALVVPRGQTEGCND